MNDLLRERAPIPQAAWEQIDEQATKTLKATLGSRKLVDFKGPEGWSKSAINLGRANRLSEGPVSRVDARLRQVQPLVEFRAVFELERSELEDISRGAPDADLDAVVEAAQAIALAEDKAVFRGYAAAGIQGIVEASGGETQPISDDYEKYPGAVAEAIHILRARGVSGPYGIALGPRCFTGLNKTIGRNGSPVIEHVRQLLGGPTVSVPAVEGAVVLSLRGGDFEMTVGRDLSVGYLDHTSERVRLYIEESMTFRVLESDAAVPLVYPKKGR